MFGGGFSASPVQGLLQQGFGFLQQGRVEEAWNAFHQVLARDPSNAVAHQMVGIIAMQAGQVEMGVQSMRRAIAAEPNDPGAHANLGNGLRELQRHDEALDAYASALALAPGHLDALNNRAVLYGRLGRHAEALADYDLALSSSPQTAFLHHNRAQTLFALGRLPEALDAAGRAASLDPANPDVHFAHGNLLAEVRLREKAVAAYDRVLTLQPGSIEAMVNRANVLVDLDRAAEALAGYDAVLAIQPDMPQALSNRGNALRILGRHAEALEACTAAARLDPAYPDPLMNRATALGELCRFAEAVADYEACLALRPGAPQVMVNSGTAYLTLGDYKKGWERYEQRWRMTGPGRFVEYHDFPQPAWDGAPLDGRTILLVCEQGLGDSLQFCRFAAQVKAAGAGRVILRTEQALGRLMTSLKGVDQVVLRGGDLPPFDVYASLMSLPYLLGCTLDTVPADIPYLSPDPADAERWAERLGDRKRPRVGLVWSGGFRRDTPELWNVNSRRNIPLPMLAAFAGAAVDFYSLQKGEEAEQELADLAAAGWGGPEITNFAADFGDFADTAAFVQSLDLVIAVDTSTAHLAGALGKPVWLLNRFDTCWRWLLDRTDSPWYPTVRQFRQPRLGDWESVVAEARAALDQFAAD